MKNNNNKKVIKKKKTNTTKPSRRRLQRLSELMPLRTMEFLAEGSVLWWCCRELRKELRSRVHCHGFAKNTSGPQKRTQGTETEELYGDPVTSSFARRLFLLSTLLQICPNLSSFFLPYASFSCLAWKQVDGGRAQGSRSCASVFLAIMKFLTSNKNISLPKVSRFSIQNFKRSSGSHRQKSFKRLLENTLVKILLILFIK